MPRLLRIASPAIPFILATLAFAFTLLSLTSRDWSSQNAFDPSLDMTDWAKPLFSRYRSPFQICEVSRADTASTAANESTTISTYTLSCQKYDAFGFGKTSCESVYALKGYTEARAGDQRLCQQIHKSGNLIITSTTFIGLGFMLVLLLTLLSLQPIKSSTSSAPPTNGDATGHVTSHKKKSGVTPLLNLVIVTSLSIGAITAFLSQFYGILAFIQSQPPNGAWASGRGNVIDPTQDNASGPWVEGVVLKAYLTCTWVFAAFGAVSAGAVWRLPRWEKL